MSQIKCTYCGEDAVKGTIIPNVYVCDDEECLLELANEHFIDETIDVEELNAEYDLDFLDEE